MSLFQYDHERLKYPCAQFSNSSVEHRMNLLGKYTPNTSLYEDWNTKIFYFVCYTQCEGSVMDRLNHTENCLFNRLLLLLLIVSPNDEAAVCHSQEPKVLYINDGGRTLRKQFPGEGFSL